jgi:opacity protein-like surface antigen
MRKLILGAIGLLLISMPGWAQESYPKAELFGGFSLSSIGGGSPSTRTNLYGWQAAVNGNFHRRIGVVGDFGGQYKSIAGISISNYQYLFGPQISMRQEKITPFVHSLVGFNRASALGASSTNLGLGIGGGLDLNISDRLALRVPQFDWTPIHAGGVWTTNVIRVGFGVVIKAGE